MENYPRCNWFRGCHRCSRCSNRRSAGCDAMSCTILESAPQICSGRRSSNHGRHRELLCDAQPCANSADVHVGVGDPTPSDIQSSVAAVAMGTAACSNTGFGGQAFGGN
mmetsp:Transcript_11475/g.31067  ORF Transcript_11475/g.31067 Transcript_11475/m.31067 type:complete len:109 (-) Transcript_11475:13-339(-)